MRRQWPAGVCCTRKKEKESKNEIKGKEERKKENQRKKKNERTKEQNRRKGRKKEKDKERKMSADKFNRQIDPITNNVLRGIQIFKVTCLLRAPKTLRPAHILHLCV
jgi:hypothetical protein